MTSPIEWAELVRKVANDRDRESFARLFDEFGPRLKGYLIRQGCDAVTAEEVIQDTMVTLWRKAALFDPAKSSLATWLYRIARNRRIDLLRRDRHDYVDPLDATFTQIAGTDAPEQSVVDGQHEQAVRSAVAKLPPEQAALIDLAFFEGLSHSQIAEKTGLPLGTVKSRLRLAFTRLRRTLEQNGVASPA